MRILPGSQNVGVLRRWSLGAVCVLALGTWAAVGRAEEQQEATGRGSKETGDVVITIVFDNNAGPKELVTDWGFGCVIQGLEKTILFDTGGNGNILLGNMEELKLDPKEIDAVVLSHIHGDHIGGMPEVAKHLSGVPVYIPTGFPLQLQDHWRSLGLEVKEAGESVAVCEGAKTTGTLGKGAIEEHGLCVKTGEGWVLITGCAHPGVANMAAQAQQITGAPLHLVVGGFHMGGQPKARIEAVVNRFEELGIRRVAPCHCTGEAARKLFAERFGERCNLAGVGTVFRFTGPEKASQS